ncbi:hypothetical protein RESH_00319 [Rhodopirellula europaea SH398]|uniref:Uncharacterized protein n=1 Tax=Rhodopirellula europaea SH398 TaxID=1263868 RepID=M5SCJ1_9BACT|nr:hypothetical protein RESH_00319 [Rhodopirellula europaea SH398]
MFGVECTIAIEVWRCRGIEALSIQTNVKVARRRRGAGRCASPNLPML